MGVPPPSDQPVAGRGGGSAFGGTAGGRGGCWQGPGRAATDRRLFGNRCVLMTTAVKSVDDPSGGASTRGREKQTQCAKKGPSAVMARFPGQMVKWGHKKNGRTILTQTVDQPLGGRGWVGCCEKDSVASKLKKNILGTLCTCSS